METLKRLLIFSATVAALSFAGCNSSQDNNNDTSADTLETDTISGDEMQSEVIYQIPSPDEFFGLLKSSGCKFRNDIINSDKAVYQSKAAQELNLGVYTADLAYLAAFDKFQLALKYFAIVKNMSDQIGLSTAIGSEMYSRLEKNITNSDSLVDITNNSYYNVIQKLEESGNGNTLAMLMTGGWIESLYISVMIADKYEQDNPTIQRIAGLKLSFGNLLLKLQQYNGDENIAGWVNRLGALKDIFDKIEKEPVENAGVQNSDTTKVIVGQKSRYIFPKELFDKLKQEVSKLREQIVKMT